MPLLADPVQIDPADYEQTFNVKFVGYKGTSTLTDFPVLIRLSAELNGFKYAKCADGANLRFADSDGNLIPHEIDTWDANGTSLVWVKVPSLTKDTVIKVYYGYKGSGTPPAVTASDVWSNGYVGVWHLNESALPMKESSGVSTDFSSAAGTGAVYASAGAIGGAVDFSGGDAHASLLADDDDDLDGFTDCTFEVWTKQDAEPSRLSGIFEKRKSSSADFSYFIYNNYSASEPNKQGRNIFIMTTNGSTAAYPVGSGHDMAPVWGEWCHQAFVRDVSGTGKGYGYVNGAKKTGSSTSGAIHASAEPLRLGNHHGGAPFDGKIDEVRISNVARSDDWLQASHDTVAVDGFAYCYLSDDNVWRWSEYSRRFTVSFPGYTGGTALADFPVLVKIAEYDVAGETGILGFSYADCALAGGCDLRFADADGNLLASEVELWNPAGESLVWVKVPSLAAGTTITAYYGALFAPQVAASGVWANGYIGVWHLDEDNDKTQLQDSTAFGHVFKRSTNSDDGVPRAGNMTNGVPGVAGTSIQFVGSPAKGQYSAADKTGELDGYAAMTLEVWTYQDDHNPAEAPEAWIIRKYNGGSLSSYLMREAKNDGRTTSVFFPDGDAEKYVSDNSVIPARATWNYSVATYDSVNGSACPYLNGSALKDPMSITTGPVTNIVANNAMLCLGNSWDGGGNQYKGCIDEVRISKVARSAAWIKATYDTIKNNATFTAYGPVKENGRKGLMIILR